jgi:hypothetical protein
MSQIASFLCFLATLVGFVCFIIKSDNWLLAGYMQLVDVYQITTAIALFILAPLLVIKPLRRLLHPCFAIARATLMFCCWALSFLAVYGSWGTTGVTIGLLFAWIGGIPMAVVACVTKGAWPMLFHSVIPFIGFIACFFAELFTDPTARLDETSGSTPDSILQASNSMWVCMALAIPTMIGMALNEPYGVLIVISVMGLYALIGVGVRKGYKIASIAYALLVIPVASQYILLIGDFDIQGVIKLEGNALLNLFSSVQTVIACYALAMLLTPSALKWTWGSAPKASKVVP